jgi:hypothetical protein
MEVTMKTSKCKALLVAGMLSLTWFASAQTKAGAWRYDAANEVSIRGTVDEVLTTQRGNMIGVHLKVKTEDTVFDVRLGPAWLLEKQKFTFSNWDQIVANGAAVPDKSGQVMIAREVRKGDTVLVLRDVKGFPRWSGGRGR